jgi:glycosyltransferase involved in cell wall biosynthesis
LSEQGPWRIAVVGQRGVPATFGGIERHVEEIGARLAARGHEVTVFLRNGYVSDAPPTYRGMHLRQVPTVSSKRLECIVHSALCTCLTLRHAPDIVQYHALGPSLLAPLPRLLSRARVVATVHGLDHEREKWGFGARSLLRAAGWTSAHVPDATIVVSRALADYYARHHHREAIHVPNGVNTPVHRPAQEITERFGLRQGGYLLFVGRLVPEKAVDLLVRAFGDLPGDMRLVVAGGSSHTDEYTRRVRELAAKDARVILTDYVYGATLEELYSNAAAFVLPSTVEGLPLTLLEAASHGTPVVASAIAPHLEILGADGPGHRLFAPRDRAGLTAAMRRVLGDPSAERRGAADLRTRVLATYSWDEAARATERVYAELLERRVPVWAPAPALSLTGARAHVEIVGRPESQPVAEAVP